MSPDPLEIHNLSIKLILSFYTFIKNLHVCVIPCKIYGSNWDCLQKQQLFKHQVSWEYKNCVFRRADCNDLCKFSCFCVFVLFECKWRHQLKKLNRERGKQLSLLKIIFAVIILVAFNALPFFLPLPLDASHVLHEYFTDGKNSYRPWQS